MKINLVSKDNGVGLTQDIKLLAQFLSSLRHQPTFVDWEVDLKHASYADVNIYLELFDERWLKLARHHVGIFNPEWFQAQWIPFLPKMSQLWAKSRAAHAWYNRLELTSTMTGFLSRDMHDPSVKREIEAIHVCGRSSAKGTNKVIDTWSEYHSQLPKLAVFSQNPISRSWYDGRISQGYVSDTTIRREMNRAKIHICPSEVEGWGHYITEATSCGALVVTLDTSPMNEHVIDVDKGGFGILLKPIELPSYQGYVKSYTFDPKELAQRLQMSKVFQAKLDIYATRARLHWEARQRAFKTSAAELLRRMDT